MSEKIDIFAHVLPQQLFAQIKSDVPDIMEKYAFLKIPALTDLTVCQENFPKDVKQVISNVNLNPEDFYDAQQAVDLCDEGNQELLSLVGQRPDLFAGAIAMVPMNNLKHAVKIVENLAAKNFWGNSVVHQSFG